MSRHKSQPLDWLPQISVYACKSSKKARKLAKRHADCEFGDLGADATTGLYLNGNNLLAVVLVKGFDMSNTKLAILAHECAHVVNTYFDNLREGAADSEAKCYMMQAVFLACLDQFGCGDE